MRDKYFTDEENWDFETCSGSYSNYKGLVLIPGLTPKSVFPGCQAGFRHDPGSRKGIAGSKKVWLFFVHFCCCFKENTVFLSVSDENPLGSGVRKLGAGPASVTTIASLLLTSTNAFLTANETGTVTWCRTCTVYNFRGQWQDSNEKTDGKGLCGVQQCGAEGVKVVWSSLWRKRWGAHETWSLSPGEDRCE